MKKIWDFFRTNYIPFLFLVAAVIVELMGVLVTSGKFYVRTPWMWLSILAIVCGLQFLFKSHTVRFWISSISLIIFFVFDLVFIVIFEMTGTIFDFSMLKLRGDAMAIVESVPINFAFFTVSGIVVSLFIVFGKSFVNKVPQPSGSRLSKIVASGALVAALVVNCVCGYLVVAPTDYNDMSNRLYSSSDSAYSDRGIIGNFISEMYQAMYFKVEPGDLNELNDYVYKTVSQPTELFGVASGYNVVTILCESLEWFAFMKDEVNYPYGHYDVTEEELRELYPNLYSYFDNDIVMTNFHAREKTDISENLSIIGNYPTDYYLNYDYPTNSLPYSMPNIMRNLKGADCNSFHNGQINFYNRKQHHTKSLGFSSFTASEDMVGEYFNNYMETDGERNLDSEMVKQCRDEMFPTDTSFYTYITTITMHGQYNERKNLQPYYQKLDEYGILPHKTKKDGKNYENDNIFRTYAAACMDVDVMLGEIDRALEEKGLKNNTVVVLFSDHNAYYSSTSNYVKDIYLSEKNGRNLTDLYKIPFMIRVGDSQVRKVVNKFTCTSDIVPTILDLLGIKYYDNIFYGNSAFSDTESLLYSRAYNIFMTDKVLFSTLNNITYKSPEVDSAYMDEIEQRALSLLDKVAHINRLFVCNFFKGDRGTQLTEALKELNG